MLRALSMTLGRGVANGASGRDESRRHKAWSRQVTVFGGREKARALSACVPGLQLRLAGGASFLAGAATHGGHLEHLVDAAV